MCLQESGCLSILLHQLKGEEDTQKLTKISVLRIIMQGIRIQRDWIDKILAHKQML